MRLTWKILAAVGLIECVNVLEAAPIPYPSALDAAAVNQPALTDLQKNGLVIGNGELNAIVYAAGDQIRLRVSKNDCWDGRIDTTSDPALPKINPATGSYSWSGTIGTAPPSWNNHTYPNAVPCVELSLAAPAGKTAWTHSTLDLAKARATVSSDADTTVIRALAHRNAFLIQTARPLSFVGANQVVSNSPALLGGVGPAGLISSWVPDVVTGTTNGYCYARQTIHGDADASGMDIYCVAGTRGTNQVVAVVTSRDSATPLADAVAMVKTILGDTAKAVSTHETVWRDFWAACGIQIGDPVMQNWWYRMVYYNRCFAKAGANAYGLKAGLDMIGGWHGSPTMNYNIQQAYCLGGPVNHPEFIQPFVDALNRLLPRARWLATNIYAGVREGACFNSNWWPFEPDPLACTTPNRHQMVYLPWGFSWGMSGHAMFNFWEFYQYQPTPENLRRIWPTLREVGKFYCALLEQCPLVNGKRRLAPSYYPEVGSFGVTNSCYDLVWIKYTLNAARRVAGLMGDLTFSNRCAANLALLPDYTTTTDPAQGGTVIEDWLGSGLQNYVNLAGEVMPVFPADEVTWFSDQATKDLFARTIQHDEAVSPHINANVTLNIARARLSLPGIVDNLYQCFGTHSAISPEQPNGLFYWKGHGYYLAEQVAIARVVAEMLLQCAGDIIRVFPAWPVNLDGHFRDLRARGGFLVSADQTGGVIANVKITSTLGGKVSLLNPWTNATPVVVNASTGGKVVCVSKPNHVLTFPTTAGTTYTVVPAAPATSARSVHLDTVPISSLSSPEGGEGRGEEVNGFTNSNPLTPTLSPLGRAEGVSTVPLSAPARLTTNFNRDWKFQLGDVAGAGAAGFNDAPWTDAHLPHSFSLPYFAANDKFYTGYGWYRKHFDVPAAWTGKRVNLEFDGAFQVAEVFVNGRRIGEHQGGYTGFSFDVTDAVKRGDNVVAVRVNNLWNARLAPRAGEHVFSGGIYRNVRLVVTDPLHVAWYGTFVTTPQVSKDFGTVNVKTEVVNANNTPRKTKVQTRILNAAGQCVAEMKSGQTIAPKTTNVFDQTSEAIPHPRLWSPEQPNLYSVQTIVWDGDQAVDDFTSPLGFRSIQFTPGQGFFLNGDHRYFRGANVHQDHAGWGDAVTDNSFRRDVHMIKGAGFDFIRGSHYPHAPAFSKACDEIGMLFWSENTFWGIGGYKGDGWWNCSAYPTNAADEAGFAASLKQQLREMIRIHRNHPSIIAWSMSNEPFFSEPRVMPQVRKCLKELIACAHELDPTRPAAVGGCQRGDIDKLGDLAGYNGDGATLPEYQKPGVASVVSEYGSTIADRPGKYEAGWGELVKTPGANPNAIGSWRLPWRSGEAIWCGFDHGSIAGREFGAMGLVDYFRLPKRQWYWYRNEYLKIPPPAWPGNGVPAALKLTADKTTLASVDGTDDAQIIVTVVDKDGKAINHCPPVTLTIESGPGEFPTGPSITFAPDSDITIRDGQAAMAFRSYHAGKSVIRASSPGLQSATIEITSQGGPKFIPGQTPPVKPRPYVRFTGNAMRGTPLILGRENPTRTSSEAPGHSGRLANDGNPATFWQAAEDDKNPWLRVDLEKIVSVNRTKLMFPTDGNWRYRIELSEDGESNWKLVADQSQNSSLAKDRTNLADSPPRGRFLRVTITGAPSGKAAALAEVEVVGTTGALAAK